LDKFEIIVKFSGLVHKTNEEPEDCQDAISFNINKLRFALSDGVSGSFFPAEWAGILVNYFCEDESKLNSSILESKRWKEWLVPAQHEWKSKISNIVTKKTGPEAYFLRNSLVANEPAAATFIGFQLFAEDDKPSWKAMIIGDSCLFHVRENNFDSYLLNKASNFDNYPSHFSSLEISNKFDPKFITGDFQIGDKFLLVTDALAEWLITQREINKNGWDNVLDTIIQIEKWKDFYSIIQEARKHDGVPLKDDDVALMIISLEATGTTPNILFRETKRKQEKTPAKAEREKKLPQKKAKEFIIFGINFKPWEIILIIVLIYIGLYLLGLVLIQGNFLPFL